MSIEPIGSMTAVQMPVQHVAEPVDTTIREIEPVEQVQNQQVTHEQASPEQIKRAVEQLNKRMSHSEAVFGIHEATNRVTIKIIDKETKELIKELPPEKTLDMIARVWEMAGILVDERR